MSHCGQKLQCPRICACGEEVRAELAAEAGNTPQTPVTAPLTTAGLIRGFLSQSVRTVRRDESEGAA